MWLDKFMSTTTRILCTLVLALSFFNVKAQEDSLIKDIIESFAENLSDDYDLSELTERLTYYRKHPIDLNQTSPEELKNLIFLSPLQISNFFNHLHTNGKLWEIIAMSLAAQLITFPLSIYYFHQFPIYFLISNLFIMAPIALLMYLGIIILLGKLEFLAPIFEWLIKFTNSGLQWIADLPLSSLSAIWINKTELWLLCIALTLFILALAGFKKQMLLISLACFMVFQSFLAYDKLKAFHQKKAIVFNLRKNYASAFIWGQKAMVITNLNPTSRDFKYFIQPALDQHKIKEIVWMEGSIIKEDDR